MWTQRGSKFVGSSTREITNTVQLDEMMRFDQQTASFGQEKIKNPKIREFVFQNGF